MCRAEVEEAKCRGRIRLAVQLEFQELTGGGGPGERLNIGEGGTLYMIVGRSITTTRNLRIVDEGCKVEIGDCEAGLYASAGCDGAWGGRIPHA